MNSRALAHLRSDPVMARLIDCALPCQLPARRLPPFQSLIQSIIYQQLSGKAAAAILAKFQALFARNGFPSPRQVLKAKPERLRGAGLSGAKVRYVRDIARRAVAGELPSLEDCDGLTDEAIIDLLTQTKGVGRWTAQMFLIFNLARTDVLPVHDLGVRRGYQLAYGKRQMPKPESLWRFGRRWAPHRTTATWYLWRAAEPGFIIGAL
jgi:3-methyladenine DNA glycosylase/8-oxoguanine DNA glycosylase